jgi:hypothetical protein
VCHGGLVSIIRTCIYATISTFVYADTEQNISVSVFTGVCCSFTEYIKCSREDSKYIELQLQLQLQLMGCNL